MMAEKKIAEQIAAALIAGLVHPGDPGRDQKPYAMVLPMFKTAGLPEESVKLAGLTAKLVAESIVALIEAEHEIVDRDELLELRASVDSGEHARAMVPVFCKRCDKKHRDPLLVLTAGGDRIMVDGPTLIGGLGKREVKCPHRMMT